jgi:hypothetical protein
MIVQEENRDQCGRVGHDKWCKVGETWLHEGRWEEKESEVRQGEGGM